MTKHELKQINYQSWQHGNEWTEEELEFIIEHDCKCDRCDKSVDELDDFPQVDIKEDELLCEDCDREENYTYCPVCEEYYEDTGNPEIDNVYILVSKGLADDQNMKPGIYKVLRFPLFYGSCLSGFDNFFNDTLELIKETDLNSIHKKTHNSELDVAGDFICECCALKYSGKKFIHHRYIDKNYRIHYNIYERGLIKQGY